MIKILSNIGLTRIQNYFKFKPVTCFPFIKMKNITLKLRL